MSSPLQPVQGHLGPNIETPSTGAAATPRGTDAANQAREADASTGIGDVGSFISQLAAGVNALSVEAHRNEPPPEVLDEIVVASRIGEQLREAGHELRFFPSSEGGRVRIEVHDRDGNTLGTVSPAAALELAAGSPLN